MESRRNSELINPTEDAVLIIASDPSATTATPEAKSWMFKIAQFTAAIVGVGAGALYFGPAKTCATTKECGEWLSKLISEPGATGVFTAGGADFSAGAIYMGYQSVEATNQYINTAQATFCTKIGKTTLLIVVVASQNIPLLLTSLNTSSALWQTFLTVGGALPGAWFGGIKTINTEVPYFAFKTKSLFAPLYRAVSESCSRMTDAERRELAIAKHYEREHEKYLATLNAKWRYIVANVNTLNPDPTEDHLSFLFQHGKDEGDHSWLASGVHHLGSLAGLLIAANFTSGGFSNTLSTLQKFIPYLPLQVISSVLVNVSLIYGNATLTMDGMHALLDPLVDIVRGKPIHSSVFQLRPKTTLLVGGLSIAASALSYAVIATLFLQEFGAAENGDDQPELDKVRQVFLWGAMAGIDIYHLASLIHLYHLSLSLVTRNPKEQFIFKTEKIVEEQNKMTGNEFVEFANANDAAKNALLGIDEYEEEAIEDLLIHDIDSTNSINQDKAPEKSESCFSRWCSWFSSPASNNEPEQTIVNRRTPYIGIM